MSTPEGGGPLKVPSPAEAAEQFEALGRFVQGFEMMISTIRSGCQAVLAQTPTQEALAAVIFHHQCMTAGPLFEIFRAMVGIRIARDTPPISPQEWKDEKATINSVLDDLQARYRKVTEARNTFLHGNWFIGSANILKPGSSDIMALKLKVRPTTSDVFAYSEFPKSAGRVAPVSRDANAAGLLDWVDECSEIGHLIQRFTVALTFEGRPQVRFNFVKGPVNWTTSSSSFVLAKPTAAS